MSSNPETPRRPEPDADGEESTGSNVDRSGESSRSGTDREDEVIGSSAGRNGEPVVDREGTIADLSPSSKLVYKVLEYEGELTQEDLAAESRLPPRTVRYALRKLEDADLVANRVHLADARQSVYWIEG